MNTEQTIVLIITSILTFLIGYLLPRPRKKPESVPVTEENQIFRLMLKLLSKPEDWKLQTFYKLIDNKPPASILHASGLELWTANVPYADMKVRMAGGAELKFNDQQRTEMRKLSDRVIRHLCIELGAQTTSEEEFYKLFREWKTEDPELRELQEVF